MKYIVLLCDGMSDHRMDELGGKTILEYTHFENFNSLAREGVLGFINTTPDGWYPGSDVCNLSIFGYDPEKYYTGRSPIEAANIGIELGENDMAFRCNLVTLSDDRTIMEDFSGYHVTNEIAKRAVEALNRELKKFDVEFYHGVGYRNLMVVRDADFSVKTTAPHDIMGEKIEEYLPKGENSEFLINLIRESWEILDNNFDKVNSIWLWGEGKKPTLPPFKEKFGLEGAVVAAVDLVRGIGKLADMKLIDVPGATGYIDTNFEGKARYAIDALKYVDYVYIHVEAPDEAGHMGSIEEKINAVKNINDLMLPVIIEGLTKFQEYRLLITPDHPTPVHLRTHVSEPVPALIWGSDIEADDNKFYDESLTPSFHVEEGYKISELFIRRSK